MVKSSIDDAGLDAGADHDEAIEESGQESDAIDCSTINHTPFKVQGYSIVTDQGSVS